MVIGHSAGGHLALWASVRDRLPAQSPLRSTDAFVPGAVISLAGIADLKAFGRFVPLLCGPGIIERLVPGRASTDPYADISPAQLPPPPGRVMMVSGILGAGHFDLVTPGTPAWKEVESRIVEALNIGS